MSPKLVMTVSSVVFLGLGLVLLFLPLEAATAAGLGPDAELPLQLFAGGLIGIGWLNWMGKNAVYGGIYGRPILVANLGFGVTTAGSLASAAMDERVGSWAWVLVVVFGLHTLATYFIMRHSPALNAQR